MPLGSIVQIAYAVEDVGTAARSFVENMNAGPFFIKRHIPLASATHQGRPATFDHSSAFGQWGAVQVELVQVHRATPATLATKVLRSTGIHHVACFVSSIYDEQERLERLGWPSVLDAETEGGLGFAFHDARAQLGHLLEIYEPHERVLGLYEKVAVAARGWIGDDPVREL